MIGVPYVLAVVFNAANSRNVSARALATVCEAVKSFVVDVDVEVLLCAWLAVDVLNDSDRLALASDVLVDADWLVEPDSLAADPEPDVDAEVEDEVKLVLVYADCEDAAEVLVDIEPELTFEVLVVDSLVEVFDSLVEVLLDVESELTFEVLVVDSLVEVFDWLVDVLFDTEVLVDVKPEPITWELWSTVVVAAWASVGLAAPVAPIPSKVATVAAPFL